MKIFENPAPKQLQQLLTRPLIETASLEETVSTVIEEVRKNGDQALYRFTREFDQVELTSLAVSAEEFQQAAAQLDEELKAAIQLGKQNIERFHIAQKQEVKKIETLKGVSCWQKSVAIQKVGLYIPGGTAPLFSTVLMLGVPANIAGCKELILCTPPRKDGSVHPAILFTAKLLGITQVFKIGGAQAIAAMTFGTASVPLVYKIFGPGNQYVTAAKQIVSRRGIAIDMPAGPSEVMVVADDSASPAFVAADLLSQAEHGTDSQVVLVTFSKQQAEAAIREVNKQLEALDRKEVARKALENSPAIVVADRKTALEIINEYAPEHLILSVDQAEELAEGVYNAGSVFLGHYTPESVGDYASGTNHVLPTNGFAKAYSGLNLDAFVKKITFQQLSKEGLQALGPAVEQMAAAEQLDAHKNAVSIRLEAIKSAAKKQSSSPITTDPLQGLVRPNIRSLQPYSSARSEFKGQAEIFLDANENPFETGLNRYPDPLQIQVKQWVSRLIGIHPEQIFLGNGSDEVIDLLLRIFCEPREDHILTLPPTYGMYQVSADIADVGVKKINLLPGFKIDVAAVQKASNPHAKLLFICSPNNPTGNDLDRKDIIALLDTFPGVIVIDEAYIEFSEQASCMDLIGRYPRLVVMRTFSKAWGLAGVRLGMAFANKQIIQLLNKVKPPYNVNKLTQQIALQAFENAGQIGEWIQVIKQERQRLQEALPAFRFVQHLFPSSSNFLLVRVDQPEELYQYLVGQKIIVRNRSNVVNCEGCLRLTVGQPKENDRLLAALSDYEKKGNKENQEL